eukprot:10307891-Karenia_brevis.AAC.1
MQSATDNPVMLHHRDMVQKFLDVDAVEVETGSPSVQSRVAAFQSSDSAPMLPARAWLTSLPNPQ